MTVEAGHAVVGAGDHVVQFYEHDAELARTVGRYLAEAAESGAVAIVIATAAHRGAFEAEMEAAGLDPAERRQNGTLVTLDAAATMARFMPDGRIDGGAFHRVIGGLMLEAAQTGRPVRAYGEMVALLWDSGDVLAAIELEKLWNVLGQELDFSLLCAYRSASVCGPEHAEGLQEVCHLHSAVLSAPDRDDRDAVRDDGSTDPEVSGHFPAEHDAPPAARRLVTAALQRWGHSGQLLEDAQLVLSELATNAVLHARSPFSVAARSEDTGIHLSVDDASPIPPRQLDLGPLALSGRGLNLVAALASDWGVEIRPDGKTVWAKLRP